MAQTSRRCYCSVPYCSNSKQKCPYLSFHDFPVDLETRVHWVRAIKRDEGPNFNIFRGSTYVCSQHFDPDDVYTSASGRSRIKQGAVPFRFHWNDWGKGSLQGQELVYQRARKRPRNAVLNDKENMVVPEDILEEALPTGAVAKDHDYVQYPSPSKLDRAAQRIQDLELQVLLLESKILQLTIKKDFSRKGYTPSEGISHVGWAFSTVYGWFSESAVGHLLPVV